MTKRPLRRISVQDLKVGMFVAELDRSWLDTPFLFHSKMIRNQEQVDKLKAHGIREVSIDTNKGADIELKPCVSEQVGENKEADASKPEDTIQYPHDSDPLEMNEELPQAKKIKSEVTRIIKNVFEDIRLGHSIELPVIKEKVSDIIESVFRNRDALWSLSHLKDHDEYTFTHSVNVCILIAAFGRHLGIPKERLEVFALGGLLHDVGKTQIPSNILNKPGIYSEAEYNIMKLHVNIGAKILSQCRGVPYEAILLMQQHHERFNGTGYPQRLFGNEICLAGQIAGIADVYDAMTSDRIYRKAIQPHLIIKRLYDWAGKLFDRIQIEKFIQCIGIYPYGSFVKLTKDYYGVVVSKNHTSLLRPAVLFLYHGNNKMQPTLVDLAKEIDYNGDYAYSIEEVLDPASWAIDVGQVLSQTNL